MKKLISSLCILTIISCSNEFESIDELVNYRTEVISSGDSSKVKDYYENRAYSTLFENKMNNDHSDQLFEIKRELYNSIGGSVLEVRSGTHDLALNAIEPLKGYSKYTWKKIGEIGKIIELELNLENSDGKVVTRQVYLQKSSKGYLEIYDHNYDALHLALSSQVSNVNDFVDYNNEELQIFVEDFFNYHLFSRTNDGVYVSRRVNRALINNYLFEQALPKVTKVNLWAKSNMIFHTLELVKEHFKRNANHLEISYALMNEDIQTKIMKKGDIDSVDSQGELERKIELELCNKFKSDVGSTVGGFIATIFEKTDDDSLVVLNVYSDSLIKAHRLFIESEMKRAIENNWEPSKIERRKAYALELYTCR